MNTDLKHLRLTFIDFGIEILSMAKEEMSAEQRQVRVDALVDTYVTKLLSKGIKVD